MTSRRLRGMGWAAVLVGLFYACALPVVYSNQIGEGRAAADHLNFHEPVIHAFTDEWPTPDFSNYHSATTPLYHLVLAGARVAFDPSRRGLMLLASVFTACLLAGVVLVGVRGPSGRLEAATPARAASPACSGSRAFVLALPLVGSMYVLFPGIWLLPDNAAWLGVLGMLVLALRARTLSVLLLAGSAVLTLLVLTRQIHFWTAGVMWAAAWLGTQASENEEHRDQELPHPMALVLSLFQVRGWPMRLVLAIVATIPAAAAAAYFIWLWNGLIVPRYQGVYHGWNPATPAFFLAIVGSLAPFYAAHAWHGLRRLASHRAWLGLLVVAALVLAVVPETTYDADAGRKSGIWNLVKMLPTIAGHTSPVLVVLAPIGMLLLAGLVSQVSRRSAWIFVAAMVGFVAAQTLSPQLWQRYHEPFILILLAMLVAESRVLVDMPRLVRWWSWAGPIVLALAMGVLSVVTILRDTPAASLDAGNFERSVEFEPIPVR